MEDLEEEQQEDSFDKIYKGEVSKSGTAILPSKRVRRIPEKVEFVSDKKENETDEIKEGDKEQEKVENPEEKSVK